MTTRLTITRPDDWHLHLRDGDMLARVLPDTARRFGRAIVMPNLVPPVVNATLAGAYRQRILAALPAGMDFEPLMTLYLTERTTPADIAEARASGFVHAVKWYPAGATTNSDSGVRQIANCHEALLAMEQHDLPLLVHGEVTDAHVDVFDREAVFIETLLKPLVQRYPKLRIVLEHITTRQAAEFVAAAPANVAATSGSPKFFLGTDSAPHTRGAKEAACGCAGMYSAHGAIELYAEVFEQQNALDRLEAFASFHGPDFYRLPRNTGTLTLVREPWVVPAELGEGSSALVPLRAGTELAWRLADDAG